MSCEHNLSQNVTASDLHVTICSVNQVLYIDRSKQHKQEFIHIRKSIIRAVHRLIFNVEGEGIGFINLTYIKPMFDSFGTTDNCDNTGTEHRFQVEQLDRY